MTKDLTIALRVQTEMERARRDIAEFGDDLRGVGSAAVEAARDLGAMDAAGDRYSASLRGAGETAEQQAERIRRMVEASLAQRDAMDAAAAANRRAGDAARSAVGDWQATAAAQDAAMGRYHAAEQAAEKNAAASAAAAAAADKHAKELTELLGKIDPVVKRLEELDELERRLAASRKAGAIDTGSYDDYAAKLQAQRAALTGQGQAMKLAGISAGQYQQAMRQLPMQITDITTSLVSGMPIWMVAVQQGGQIKDSFGGMGNAARAVVSLINPLTLAIATAAAAVAAAGVAYYQGSAEAEKFNEALILTGNTAGLTGDRLATMAAEVDNVAGTQRAAAAALTEVASRGKFTADQVLLVGDAAERMRLATGRAVKDTVDDFERLVSDPAGGIAKLNEQYHFLTLAEYEHIRALQDSGDAAGAAQAAMDALATANNSRSQQIVDNLGSIQRGWKHIKEGAAEAWDAMLGIGRQRTLAELETLLMQAEQRLGSKGRESGALRRLDQQVVDRLRAEVEPLRAAEAEAARAGEEQARQDAAIAAAKEVARIEEGLLDRDARRRKELEAYRAELEKIRAINPNSELLAEDRVQGNIDAINARYADKVPGRSGPSEFDRLNEQLGQRTKALQDALAAQRGLSEAERTAADVQARLRDGTLQLTDAQRLQIDAGIEAMQAAEAAASAAADADTLAKLQTQYLRSIGDYQGAAEHEIEQRYGKLLERLVARSDTAGAEMVQRLIDVDKANAEVAELRAAIDDIFAQQQRDESRIDISVQTGVTSELQARRELLDVHKRTADEIERLLPRMKELARITGDPTLARYVEQLELGLLKARSSANDLATTIKDGFQTGLQGAIEGLAKGTMTLEDAARSFVTSITDALIKLAAQQLAMKAASSMFGTGTGTGGSSGGSGGSGWVGMVANIASLFLADGGHVRGPGTGTSDSIPAMLSDGEFVTRSAVVRQPGALDFMRDFNEHGMAALEAWGARAVHHATGGLAGLPAPQMPPPVLSSSVQDTGAGKGTSVQNDIALHVYDDPNRIAEAAFSSREGVEHFFVMLSRDPQRVRATLGI